MDMKQLDAIVESYRDEIIRDIRAWVSVPSVLSDAQPGAPFGLETRRALDLALATARGYGFDVRDVDGYCGDISLGTGESTLGILCHLDVVPAGEGWTKDPWGGEIADGKLYGRGTMDDKGPAVAALHAMRAVRAAGIPLQDGVRLILGCDEETGMTDMAYYKSKFAPPDYGFSPDAEFPVINIEKGRLELQLTQRAAGGGAYPIRSMHAGERVNVVPGVAEAEVALTGGDFASLDVRVREVSARLGHPIACERIGDDGARITATGKSAHAAMAENGVNAAGLLLIALKEIGAGGGLNDAIGALADVIGLEYDGKSLGIQAKDEESGHLTCNLGVLRADGDGISAQLDIRYPICENEERLCGRAAMAISSTGLSLRRLGGHAPHHVPAEHKVVKGLIEVYSEVTGTPGYAFAIGGGTYSRCMPNTVAFGFNYPGDTDTCHMPDEYVDIEKLMMSVRIFARAIAKLAGGEA